MTYQKPSQTIILAVMAITLIAGCSAKKEVQPTATDYPVPTEQPATEAVPLPQQQDVAPDTFSISTGSTECTLTTSAPTEEEKALVASLDPISENDHVFGNPEAKLSVLVYGDLSCPACQQAYLVLEDVVKTFPSDVNLVYRHLPLTSLHPMAMIAAAATEAAAKQGKYFELVKYLYEHQNEWSGLTSEAEFVEWVTSKLVYLDINPDVFAEDVKDQSVYDAIYNETQAHYAEGLTFTPLMVMGGKVFSGYQDLLNLISVQSYNGYTSCPEWVIVDGVDYGAVIKTSFGDVVVDLLEDQAPLAVNNFVFLAKAGYYNNTYFHRVVESAIAQAGDPSNSSYLGPGFTFPDENLASSDYAQPGMVGLANAGNANTNGSQFFITLKPYEGLTGRYTLFGTTDQAGLDILALLTPFVSTWGQTPPAENAILTITITEK